MKAPRLTPEMAAGRRFEDEVWQLLLAHRRRLRIADVLKATSLRIDGVLRLTDGQVVPVECKLRLSLPSAAIATWQLAWFAETDQAKALGAIRTAVVFFERFGHDWADPVAGALRGWRNWYREHSTVHTSGGPLRVYLVQVADGRLNSGPVARRGAPWANAEA